MEYGEIDLAHMLLYQREREFDIHFIGLYWRHVRASFKLRGVYSVSVKITTDLFLIFGL